MLGFRKNNRIERVERKLSDLERKIDKILERVEDGAPYRNVYSYLEAVSTVVERVAGVVEGKEGMSWYKYYPVVVDYGRFTGTTIGEEATGDRRVYVIPVVAVYGRGSVDRYFTVWVYYRHRLETVAVKPSGYDWAPIMHPWGGLVFDKPSEVSASFRVVPEPEKLILFVVHLYRWHRDTVLPPPQWLEGVVE